LTGPTPHVAARWAAFVIMMYKTVTAVNGGYADIGMSHLKMANVLDCLS
jgi:hypothetical protein